MMTSAIHEVLLGIRTVAQMVEAFRDEERCRRLVEALVWPNGRVCPACGYKRSIALAGRDIGRYRARPGLYQCSNGACHFQFTATTRTPLHATKLSLEHLAQSVVADPAVGQGAVLHSLGRSAWGKPADGVAHWTCAAPDAGAREPTWRHGRDRRILSRRTAEEEA